MKKILNKKIQIWAKKLKKHIKGQKENIKRRSVREIVFCKKLKYSLPKEMLKPYIVLFYVCFSYKKLNFHGSGGVLKWAKSLLYKHKDTNQDS